MVGDPKDSPSQPIAITDGSSESVPLRLTQTIDVPLWPVPITRSPVSIPASCGAKVGALERFGKEELCCGEVLLPVENRPLLEKMFRPERRVLMLHAALHTVDRPLHISATQVDCGEAGPGVAELRRFPDLVVESGCLPKLEDRPFIILECEEQTADAVVEVCMDIRDLPLGRRPQNPPSDLQRSHVLPAV